MRLVIILLSLLAAPVLIQPNALAYSSHTHDVTEKRAKELAKKRVKKLIAQRKIPESWSKVDAHSAEQKIFNGQKEWVITLKNEKAPEGRQTLFIFMTTHGKFVAANFTGK